MTEEKKISGWERTERILKAVASGLNPRSLIRETTSFFEFLIDHLNRAFGHLFIMASPLISPLPSGWAVWHALVGTYGFGAYIVAAVVEGLGFAAVDAKNKIEMHNRANPNDPVDDTTAKRLVKLYLVVTVTLIFCFETIPAWIGVWYNDQTVAGAMLATAPLVFPFLANLGASIYSLMSILTNVNVQKEAKTTDRLTEQAARIEQLLADGKRLNIEHANSMNALRAEHERAVARINDEHSERTERLNIEHERTLIDLREQQAKLHLVLEGIQANYSAVQIDNARLNGILDTLREREQQAPTNVQQVSMKTERVQHHVQSEQQKRQARLLRMIRDSYNGVKTDEFNKSEVAKKLGTTHTTISRDLEALHKAELITVNHKITVNG